MKTKEKRKDYESPEVEEYLIHVQACICQSPGGGGSEGTGDEPLIPELFDDVEVFDDLLF